MHYILHDNEGSYVGCCLLSAEAAVSIYNIMYRVGKIEKKKAIVHQLLKEQARNFAMNMVNSIKKRPENK